MHNSYWQSKNPEALTARSKSVISSAFDLMEFMSEDLSADKSETLLAVLRGGGRVGIEITADRHSQNQVSLVAIEPEGKRLVLATVATPQIDADEVEN
jgi:hypothetical protein